LPSNFGDFWQFWQLWQISRAAGFALPITAIPRDDGDSGDLYLCFLIPPCFKVLPSNFGDFWHFWPLPAYSSFRSASSAFISGKVLPFRFQRLRRSPKDNLLSPQRFGFIKPLVVALEGNV
jgi:hypothetical protein